MAEQNLQAMQRERETEARKRIQEQRELSERANEEGRGRGKPTPTQEELDLHMMGVPLEKHEDDGSGPEIVMALVRQQRPASTGERPTSPQPSRTPRSTTTP
jgi:hypothetical protein